MKGGKPIAEGGYGCVFRPALKCSNEDKRSDGVSKLMPTQKAMDEFMEIKSLRKKLKNIPNYKSKYMIPLSLCQPDKLTSEDMTSFTTKCENLSQYGKDPNKKIDKYRIINLPDGGKDIQSYTDKDIKTNSDLLELHVKLISFLKNTIIPMNVVNVFHTDVKDNNVMVNSNKQLILIDWGLAGSINDKSKIPSFLSNRPLQFNIPFGIVFFNDKSIMGIHKFIQQNPQYSFDELKTFMKAFYRDTIKVHLGVGHEGFLTNIFNQYIFEFTRKDFKEALFEYLATAVKTFTKNKTFDIKSYLFDVYLKNVDIWGFITIYFTFLMKRTKGAFSPEFYKGLKNLLIDYLLGYPDKPIPVYSLIKDLENLNDLIKPSTKKTATIFIKLNKAPPTPKSFEKNKNSPVIEFVRNKASSPSKTKKKRCPNGTRRNKKTGKCEPYTRKKEPWQITPV